MWLRMRAVLRAVQAVMTLAVIETIEIAFKLKRTYVFKFATQSVKNAAVALTIYFRFMYCAAAAGVSLTS
jgi:hypothetical protein